MHAAMCQFEVVARLIAAAFSKCVILRLYVERFFLIAVSCINRMLKQVRHL